MAKKVPRQCPLVLPVTIGLVKAGHLEMGKVERLKVEEGENLSWVSYTVFNFDIRLGW
jgi:hypothetical protein